MNLTFDLEDPIKIWDEAMPLLKSHYEEVAAFKDEIKLNPDKDFYKRLQDSCKFYLFTLRDAGKLIGYNAFFVDSNPHYMDKIFAKNDVLYIDPDYRNGKISVDFVKASEAILKQEGVDVVIYHMKVYKPFEKLMESTGHEQLEYLYGKVI